MVKLLHSSAHTDRVCVLHRWSRGHFLFGYIIGSHEVTQDQVPLTRSTMQDGVFIF